MKNSNTKRNARGLKLRVAIIPALAVAAAFAFHYLGKDSDALILYCSHDAIHAEKAIRLFEKQTGIKVIAKFDTEATKSLGLVELIRKEHQHPRCDVFWNNQALGTMELASEGLLQPYTGQNHARIPDRFKSPKGYWCGFAARMRMVIVNTDKLPPQRQAIDQAIANHPEHMAIANPLYGTTLTHFALLAKQIGIDTLKRKFDKMRADGVRILNGNSAVKDAVAAGGCDFGWTDTDDFLVAKRSGAHVAAIPAKLPDGTTILIPNTVAIIKGTKKLSKAKRLVDFLLSEECETLLANGSAGQIPLGTVDERKIPKQVRQFKKMAANSAPITDSLLEPRRECIEWLRNAAK